MTDSLPDNVVTIHTDGACSGNPGAGGYGAVMRWRDKEQHLQGYEPDTTNNRMELMAAIAALEALKRAPVKVELYTDSKYLKDGMEKWLHGWKANGWRTSTKKPVKNRDLWERLDEVINKHHVNFHWVEGHSGDYYNELADSLARQAIDENRA